MCGKFPAAFPRGALTSASPIPPIFPAACPPADMFGAAAWALKYGGDFFLVHRPERLAELIIRGSEVNLEAKRLCLVRHRADSPVNLVLLQLRKGGKPSLKWEEIVLHDASGAPTEQYRRIYHL